MNNSLKKIQKIKIFLKKKLKKQKITTFLFKKLQILNFILTRIKFRLLKNKKYFLPNNNLFTICHNKKIFLNFQYIKKKIITNSNLSSDNLKNIQSSLIIKSPTISTSNCYIKSTRFLFFKRKFQKKKIIFFFTLYDKLVSSFFNKGKRSKWSHYFINILELICFSLNYSIVTILSKIFIKLYTKVELKKINSKNRISYIPYFIKLNRSLFLTLKWIFLGAIKNNTTTSLKNKLYIELVQLISSKTCFCFQKFEENNINSFKNRSNIHFRWQKTR